MNLEGSAPEPGTARSATPSLRRLAMGVSVCTLVLVFLGGSVTSNDAGMAFPDWPTVDGQNMFLYPPSQWVGDKFFEHVHRLAGATVGMLSIALAIWTHLREPRRWVRVLAWCILGAVIIQGVMGGLRVTERSIFLAIVHGCFAQLFFGSTVCLVVFFSRGWAEDSPDAPGPSRALRRFCAAVAVTVLVQLILGAIYRHLGKGLAFHVTGAIVVTMMISVLAMWITGEYVRRRLLMRLTKILAVLFVTQLVLGVAAYVSTMQYDASRPATLWEWLIPSLHVAVGAAILAITFAMTASAYRFAAPPSEQPVGAIGSGGAT